MNIRICVLFSFLIIAACSGQQSPMQQTTEEKKAKKAIDPRFKYDFENNGRDTTGKKFKKTFELGAIDAFDILKPSSELKTALNYNLSYLKRRKYRTYNVGNTFRISKTQLVNTVNAIQRWANSDTEKLGNLVKAYQIKGDDDFGNVKITGYFIPVLKVKAIKDDEFKYAIYRKPRQARLRRATRKQIDDQHILAGRGLEIAYSNDLLGNFFMQVQGSGIIEYPDGRQSLLSYDGVNGRRYNSIGRYLVDNGHYTPDQMSLETIREWVAIYPDSLRHLLNHNPSYVYFTQSGNKPKGAAAVPLTALNSVAVDKRYFPLGTCLLAAVPVLDSTGELLYHEYRIVVAQDVGGAIKGPGRMDFFCGIGETGKNRAGALKHYGRVWILVAK